MAEGFLQPNERNDVEYVGDKFVNVLLHSSLLQVAPINDDDDEEEPINDDDDEEEICVMHDLVHDLANSVLGSLKVRYMRHEDELSPIAKESAKYLRTLFIQGEILEFKLSDFKCLHVLSFESRFGELLSSSIGKLIHLRKLKVSKTIIKCLPDSIGELHHLQTLRANSAHLKKLPRTLKYLISLRHLYIYNHNVKLPSQIGRLTSLQTLTHFRVGKKNGYQIEELGRLKNLKGKLRIFNLEKVQGKEEAKKANIFQNPSLFELKYEWHYVREEGERNYDESVLEGLQPTPNLKKLEIHRFRGKRFPLWTMKMAVREEPQGCWVGLNKLVKIILSDCRECEEIPMLGYLPNLKHLNLRGFRNVESINSSFYGIDNIGVCQETIIVFPALERLELYYLPKLREWAEVEFPESLSHEVKVFPRLKYLKIHCEFYLLTNMCGVTLISLTDLCIEGLYELKRLPDWLFHYNQNLSKLEISDCNKLRELPDGLQTLNSLKELRIERCRNLKAIGKIVALNSLEDLTISSVPKLMATRSVESWHFPSLRVLRIDARVERSRRNNVAIKQTVDAILRGCNHSLVELDLRGLQIWEYMPESIQNLTSLQRLFLENLGIEELPVWFRNFSSLQYLMFQDCPKLSIDSEWCRINNPHILIAIDSCIIRY